MKCKEVENNLIFFIEGNLPENKMTDIKNHFQTCDNCNLIYKKMKSDFLFIEHDKISEPNPFFYNRLAERLQKEENKKTSVIQLKSRKFYIQAAAYAAVVVLSIFLGIGLGDNLGSNNDIAIDNYEEITESQMFADSYNLNQPSENIYELEIAENK